VLEAALQIVDEQGLDGLTMRRLGAALGVDPMTVYHYVPDKSALFDGLVESVYAEIVIPSPTGVWVDDLRAIARSTRTALLAHPHLISVIGSRPPITEAAFDLMEAVTAIGLRAGFSEQHAADLFDCTGRLVVGHVLAEAGPPASQVSGGEDEHSKAQSGLPVDRYPCLATVQGAGVAHDTERIFELGLDGLVAVFNRQREPPG
jgi:TetR/AcrR family transcriptional regulator, tetracycline repressor protein